MLQTRLCLVGALGLHEHEIRLVKSILKLSHERDSTRYEWTEELSDVHVLIVCADDEAEMNAWHVIAQNRPSTVMLLITPHLLGSTMEYFLSRPIAPSKVLVVLDKIYKEKLADILEPKIFAGEDKVDHHEAVHAGPGIASASHHVLVVDDSPTVRKQLEQEFGLLDIRVDMAESGEQCLEMLEKKQYDIIFLDVVMPGADGYEVCKNIRKSPLAKRTPVIMLTSKSSSFDRVRGALAGCNAYLTKPVDYEKFHKVLGDYLKKD